MSISACRSYFRARANAVELREWKDGFSIGNIPSNIFNKAFHIEISNVSGVKLNQNDQELNVQITVRIFVKGFKDVSGGIDTAASLAENLITEALDPATRLTQTTGIKQVTLDSINIDPPDGDNDNLVIASVQFKVLTILSVA